MNSLIWLGWWAAPFAFYILFNVLPTTYGVSAGGKWNGPVLNGVPPWLATGRGNWSTVDGVSGVNMHKTNFVYQLSLIAMYSQDRNCWTASLERTATHQTYNKKPPVPESLHNESLPVHQRIWKRVLREKVLKSLIPVGVALHSTCFVWAKSPFVTSHIPQWGCGLRQVAAHNTANQPLQGHISLVTRLASSQI